MHRAALASLLLALGACADSPPPVIAPVAPAVAANPAAKPFPVPPAIQAIVDAPDRSPEDRKLDAGRHPGELLAFAGIKPGWKVAEIASGGGYTAELLARAVGPTGVVYGQNNKFVIEKYAKAPWEARLAKPVNKNVVRVDREFDDPLPPEAKDLDAVVVNLFYHDAYWMPGSDVPKLNAAVYRALKPGGVYVILDHSARAGAGTTAVKSLHRIEEKVVPADMAKAGFRLDLAADFLRNPDDSRDWSASPSTAGARRGTSDRFALRFVK